MAGKTAQAKRELTVDEAEAEVSEAGALVLALEERIRSGDASVSAEELSSAKNLAEFARLQHDAARRRAEQATRDAAAEQMQIAVHTARSFAQTNLAKSERLRVAAAKALAAYMDEVDRMSYQASEVLRQVEAADVAASAHGLETATSFSVRAWQGHLAVGAEDGELLVPAKQLTPGVLLGRVLADLGLSISAHTTEPVNGNRPWPPQD